MGKPETKSNIVQESINHQLAKPSQFVEDMSPEERARFYKDVLKVNLSGSAQSWVGQPWKHLLSQFHTASDGSHERVPRIA